MPAVAADPARRVVAEGTLEVLVEDHSDRRLGRTRHFVKAGSERLELRSSGKGRLRGLRAGARVRLEGTRDGALYLDLDGSSGSVTTLANAPEPTAIGEQRTAIILVNFEDRPTDRPWTADQVRNVVFGTVSNFFVENSFGKTWLAGDVLGWYTIAQSSASCDQLQTASAARAAASAAGVDVTSYARLVYLFPKTSACYWSGTASVGGTPSQAWINGEPTLDVFAHELGHNLGLHHSHASICSGTTIGDTCRHSEYGDSLDVMGGAKSAHFNAFQKEYLGWLNGVATPTIQTVSSSGTYTIDPYASGPGPHAKALKILKGTEALTGKRTYYYLEYRQPVGFDTPLGDPSNMLLVAANVTGGVVAHTGSADESGNTSFMLDMTPETYDMYYPRDPALVVGRAFSDAAAGVTIDTAWANGNTAGVTVTLKATGCTRNSPLVAVSPSSQQAAPGGVVAYSVTVTNRDTAACGASTFGLQRTLPSGWSGSFAGTALGVAPGASASTTMSVASPTAASGGSYAIAIDAINGSSPAQSATASATYAVVTAPSVTLVTDKPGYALGQTVRMITSVKAGGVPVAKAGVSFVVTAPNGSAITLAATADAGGVAEARYRIGRRNALGVYRATATSTAAGGSGSGSASFAVQ